MAKKKVVQKYEGSGLDEEHHLPLTSDLIEPEKQLEEVSEKKESDYEKHPKFSKFKGEK